MNSLKIENMGNKYNYEYVLGEIACYIAKECNLTPSEAIGVVMNDDCTDAVIEEIQKSDKIDIEALASRYLTEELCAVDFKTDGYEVRLYATRSSWHIDPFFYCFAGLYH